MSETADDFRPWTIKNVPTEERNAAIAASQRSNVTMGAWLARAIRSQIQADHNQDRSPAVIPQRVDTAPSGAAMAEIERVVAMAKLVAGDGAVPRSIQRPANKLLRARLLALLPTANGTAPPQ